MFVVSTVEVELNIVKKRIYPILKCFLSTCWGESERMRSRGGISQCGRATQPRRSKIGGPPIVTKLVVNYPTKFIYLSLSLSKYSKINSEDPQRAGRIRY